jgi:hypothetical protein
VAIAVFFATLRGAERVTTATTELAVPDGSGVVTMGGGASTLRANGTYTLHGASRQGTNAVQARLDQGSGAGTWRFEFPEGGIAAGSLRVLSGEVSVVTPNAIVFRLTGKAGETIAFTYDVE